MNNPASPAGRSAPDIAVYHSLTANHAIEQLDTRVTGLTEAEARRFFDGLADGGQVRMPIGPTFWSPAFGMVQDRFGVSWQLSLGQMPDP